MVMENVGPGDVLPGTRHVLRTMLIEEEMDAPLLQAFGTLAEKLARSTNANPERKFVASKTRAVCPMRVITQPKPREGHVAEWHHV